MTDLERMKNLMMRTNGEKETTGVTAPGVLEWAKQLRVAYCSRTIEGGTIFVVVGITFVPHESMWQLTAANVVMYETRDLEEITRMYNSAVLKDGAFTVMCKNPKAERAPITLGVASREDAERIARYLSSHVETKVWVSRFDRVLSEYAKGQQQWVTSEQEMFIAPVCNSK